MPGWRALCYVYPATMTKLKFLTFLALAVPAFAQTTIKDALVKHWKVSTDFTIAVAKLMPAAAYGFKPVPAELSFGQVVVQVAGANLNACSIASGTKRPEIPEKVMQAVRGKAEIDKDSHSVPHRFLRFLQPGRSRNDAGETGCSGRARKPQDDGLRMVVGVLHAYGASSRTVGSVLALERYPAAVLRFLATPG